MLPAAVGPITGERSSPLAATPDGNGTAADKSGSVPWCSGDRVVGNRRVSGTLLLLPRARKNRDTKEEESTQERQAFRGLLDGSRVGCRERHVKP